MEQVTGNIASHDCIKTLTNALDSANIVLLEDHLGSSTTASAAIIDSKEKMIHLASVGNSRIYHISGGDVYMLTVDQGIGHMLFESLGIENPKIQTKTVPYRPGDLLFLSTDGIHDTLPDEEMNSILTADATPQQKITHMLDKVHQATSARKARRDDECAILLKLK